MLVAQIYICAEIIIMVRHYVPGVDIMRQSARQKRQKIQLVMISSQLAIA